MTLLFYMYTYRARQAADNADTNVHLQTHEDVQVSVAVVTNSSSTVYWKGSSPVHDVTLLHVHIPC